MTIHLHTTIPLKTHRTIEELAKTYGTKSRVLEQAIETFLRVEKTGSCDDCEIKATMVRRTSLRKTLDLSSISRRTLDGLLAVAIGDQSFEDFIEKQYSETRNIVTVLKDSIGWKSPDSFKAFLVLLEEIRDLTRLFDIASQNEIEKTVVLRTKTLTRMPEIVAYQVSLILEGADSPFDLRIVGEDIVLKMVRRDLFPLSRGGFDRIVSQQIRKRLDKIRPHLFRNNLVLVGPGFLHWAEKHLEEPIANMEAITEDIRTVLDLTQLPKNPEEFINSLISAGLKMNWLRQSSVQKTEDNNVIITFQATSQALAKITLTAFAVILATRGWKLHEYSIEHRNGSMTLQSVDPEDQGLLDILVELSSYQTIGRQFLDFIPVPRSVFETFASRLYKSDRRKFDQTYRNIGTRTANAIKVLARGDQERTRRLGEDFLSRNLNDLQQDAELRSADKEHFTMIFKRVDQMLIDSQRALVEAMFESLGFETSTTAFQNVLSFGLKRTEKPALEPVQRKVMMQNLVDAMSANDEEEAFSLVKDQFDEMFPEDYPWTIKEVGKRLMEMYRELDMEVEMEYFEGGFTLKYQTCPYYRLVKSGQKKWLCSFRRKTIDYIISRVTRGKKGKIKVIQSLLQNKHPCEYAIFLTGFLEEEMKE
jgi:hypothetical protein